MTHQYINIQDAATFNLNSAGGDEICCNEWTNQRNVCRVLKLQIFQIFSTGKTEWGFTSQKYESSLHFHHTTATKNSSQTKSCLRFDGSQVICEGYVCALVPRTPNQIWISNGYLHRILGYRILGKKLENKF